MLRILIVAICMTMPGAVALAAPLPVADAAKLEGFWRVNGNAKSDACGRDGNFAYGIELTMEFRLTGGQLFFNDGAEGAEPRRVISAEMTGADIVLKFEDEDTPLYLKLTGTDKLTFVSAPDFLVGGKGKTFTQCLAGESRTAIKLDRADMTFLATSMIPETPRFVDSRVKGGCKAAQYQFLDFDLAAASFPEIRRENSDALGAALANKKKVTAPMDNDGLGRWSIDGAVKTANGYSFTVTELIPPNGSRGDQTKLEIARTKTGISIPAWKRSYTRCNADQRGDQ